MPLPAGIIPLPLTGWENGHQNFKASLTPGASFDMRLPFDFDRHNDNYRATTANFQWLIDQAMQNQWQLKPLGRGWSFSEVAKSRDGLVDTRELRTWFTLGQHMVAPEYLQNGRKVSDLFFTQCGMSIEAINRELENENGGMRSLKASGASNGQTIAGATSTGTHGAAYQVGAVHDSIVGLHLVTGPDRHVWLERATYPVASKKFTDWLGAEVYKDDDLFNAAVVSFGSFGFIHGIMLETEPKFLLDKRTTAGIPYDDALRLAINAWDFEGIEPSLPLPVKGPNHELYHFEMVVNPFAFEENNAEKGAYLKVMYKKPWDPAHLPPKPPSPKFQYGDELLGLIQTVLDHVGPGLQDFLVPKMVTTLFPQAFNASEETVGTIGEIFNNTKFRGKAASAAIGIDTQYASRVLDEFVALTRQHPFAGGVALRFVKGSSALLGFTRFPKTCVLEMDGVDSADNRHFFEKMWNRLEQLNIPYTLHWGKINFNLNPQRVRNMYGDDAVNKWIACRHQLLDAAAREVFNTAFLEKCGLAG